MADIKITRAHAKDLDKLRKAVAGAARELKAEHGITCSKRGDTWTIDGTGVKSGHLAITPTKLDIEIDLAWWVPTRAVAKAVRD